MSAATAETRSTDLVGLIVTALNGTTINGGQLSAVANGHSITVKANQGTGGGVANRDLWARTWDIQVR